MFDEQPDGDPHGECAAEIRRLEAERDRTQAVLDETVRSMGDTIVYIEAEVSVAIRERDESRREVEALRLALHEIVSAYKSLVVTEMICADPRDRSDADMTMRKAVDAADAAIDAARGEG